MAFSLQNIFSALQPTQTDRPDRVVGIDLGSSSIKVVELEFTEQAPILRTYGELQLGPYGGKALGEPVQLEPQKMVEALVDMLRESGVKAQHGVLALPLAQGFVTVITVTETDPEKIKNMVPVEARKYIPMSLSEVTLDWVPLVSSQNEVDATSQDILLVAIQNESLGAMSTLMQQVQMGGQPTEIEVFSSVRATVGATTETIALIDIGASSSKLYIVADGALERIHRVTTGGARVTKKIADRKDIPFAEAENMKRFIDQHPDEADQVREVMGTVLNGPLQEFKRVIDQYEKRFNLTLDRVVLSGGTVAFPGFVQYTSDVLARTATIASPFDRVGYPAFMEDTIIELSPTLLTAIGAAERLQ